MMTTRSSNEARTSLEQLIDETSATHEPILITGERANAVLISEGDWSAVQETLYLLSVPGMRESIREGMDTPETDCARELDW